MNALSTAAVVVLVGSLATAARAQPSLEDALPWLPPGYSCKPLEYPTAAVRADAQGTVILKVIIGEDSRIDQVETIKSAGDSKAHKLLDMTSVQQIKSCTYRETTPVKAGQYKALLKWSMRPL